MSTRDGHLCVCGHARSRHLDGCCTLGCGCKQFKRGLMRRQDSGVRQTTGRLPKNSLKMVGRLSTRLYGVETGQ